MEKYLKLAPAVSMAHVKRVDSELYYQVQVIPTSTVTKDGRKYDERIYIITKKPYIIRRKWADFKAFHKCLTASKLNIRFPDISNGTKELVQLLDGYLKKVFCLPKEILANISMDKFFGEWIQDGLGTDPFHRTSKIPRTPLKKDKYDMDGTYSIIMLEMDRIVDPRLERRSQRRSAEIAKSVISHSRSHSADESRNSGRESVIPTYEEFVSRLAASLSVDIGSSKKEERDRMIEERTKIIKNDTVIDRDDVTERDTIIDRDSIIERDTIIDRDTFIERGTIIERDTIIERGTIIDKERREFSDIEDDEEKLKVKTYIAIETVSSRSSLGEPFIDVPISRARKASIDLRPLSIWPRPLKYEDEIDKETDNSITPTDDFFEKERNSPDSNFSRDSEGSYQSFNRVNGELVRETKSVDSGSSVGNFFTSSSSSPATHISPVIPSRKESRNWTVADGSINSGSIKSKDGMFKSPSRKIDYEDLFSGRRGSPSPLSSSAQPPTLSINSEQSSQIPRIKSNGAYLTLKLVEWSEPPATIKVLRSITFSNLLEKISLIIGHKEGMRLTYREEDGDLITIADDESWVICLELMTEEKLTLFITS